MKKMLMFAIGLVLTLVIVAPVKAYFTDDFESYTAGQYLGSPWTDSSGNGHPMWVNNYGFGGGKGINNQQSDYWPQSSRATNYNPALPEQHLIWKGLISSQNGIARNTMYVGNATTSRLMFEADENGNTLLFGYSGNWQTASFSRDLWYEHDVKLTQSGGNWSWQLSRRAFDGASWGAWVVLGSGSTMSGWTPDSVDLSGIYGKVMDYGVSAIDDVAFIPEPMTLSLLGIGGLTLLRRRK